MRPAVNRRRLTLAGGAVVISALMVLLGWVVTVGAISILSRGSAVGQE